MQASSLGIPKFYLLQYFGATIVNIKTTDLSEQAATTKRWAKVAVAVGLLVLAAGALGAVGLLHTYGLISLPQWLASAVGTIGTTRLWALASGGAAIGALLTVGGIVKWVKPPPTEKIEKLSYMLKRNGFSQETKLAEMQDGEQLCLSIPNPMP